MCNGSRSALGQLRILWPHPFVHTLYDGHYLFIQTQRDQYVFHNLYSILSFPPFLFLFTLLSQWSQRCMCPLAHQLYLMAVTSHWWLPASQSVAFQLQRFSGRQSCMGEVRSKVKMSLMAPPQYMCATCGSRRATLRGRHSPVWCVTPPFKQSFAYPTYLMFSVSVELQDPLKFLCCLSV